MANEDPMASLVAVTREPSGYEAKRATTGIPENASPTGTTPPTPTQPSKPEANAAGGHANTANPPPATSATHSPAAGVAAVVGVAQHPGGPRHPVGNLHMRAPLEPPPGEESLANLPVDGQEESCVRLAGVECGTLANLVVKELHETVQSYQLVPWPFVHEALANLRTKPQRATACVNYTGFLRFEGYAPALYEPTPGPTFEPPLLAEHPEANQPPPAVAEADPVMEPASPASATQMQPSGPMTPST